MSKRDHKTYYKVFALRDGTVTSVLETRKPSKRTLGREPKIDEDGVFLEYPTDAITFEEHTDAQRIQKHITIATAINVKRAVRKLVLPPLAAITEELSAIRRQLDRIERKLDEHGRIA